MKTQIQSPNGLHERYVIKKIKVKHNPAFDARNPFNKEPQFITVAEKVSPKAEYFVLRLDKLGSDIEHIKACRIAINAYADAIEHHLPLVAKDIRKAYPII